MSQQPRKAPGSAAPSPTAASGRSSRTSATRTPQGSRSRGSTSAPSSPPPTLPPLRPMYPNPAPSISEHPAFNADADMEELVKAIRGLGTDKTVIVAILTNRTSQQRQRIVEAYRRVYGWDLLTDLKTVTAGRFSDIVTALMLPPGQFEASEINKALAPNTTNELVLIEILYPLSNEEISRMKTIYEQYYHKAIETEVMESTKLQLRKFIVTLLDGQKNENADVDFELASRDADALANIGERRWGKDDVTFNSILATRHTSHLLIVFASYKYITGIGVHQAIMRTYDGELQKILLAIVKLAENPTAYFAEKFNELTAKGGVDHQAIIRIMITRSERDMSSVRQEYQRLFGKSLQSFITKETSGDYRRALLSLST